jgi:hypothetical protein
MMNFPTAAIATHPAQRRDGWTSERRAMFLECLCEKPDIARACARVGLSRQAAYKLRRRDPVFALAWDVALQVAHDARVRRMVDALPKRTLRTLSESSWSSTSCH